MKWLERVEMLIGPDSLKKLKSTHVTVIGLGAVGYTALETLVRTGVGSVRIADFDLLRETNINRHLLGLKENIGIGKVKLAGERVLSINPGLCLESFTGFAHSDTFPEIFAKHTDIVIDAIDSFSPKVKLLSFVCKNNIPVISVMGAAGRTDPLKIRIGDISDTTMCPLAQLVRKKLRKENIINGITSIYSVEKPFKNACLYEANEAEPFERGRVRRPIGSLSHVTGVFGMFAAYKAIDMLGGLARCSEKKSDR